MSPISLLEKAMPLHAASDIMAQDIAVRFQRITADVFDDSLNIRHEDTLKSVQFEHIRNPDILNIHKDILIVDSLNSWYNILTSDMGRRLQCT